MKKIMIIHSSIGYGGAVISLMDVVDMLSEHYEIVVYLPESSPKITIQKFTDRNIRIKTFNKTLPAFAHYSGINALLKVGFWRRILAFTNRKYWLNTIISERPDAVLVNSSVLSPMASIIKKANAKAICYNRETHKLNCWGLLDKIMRRFLDKFDLVIFISNYEQQHFDLVSASCVTISDCINTRSFPAAVTKKQARKDLGLNDSEFIVLFVGGISQIKGADLAIQAMEKIQNYNNIKMLLLGNIEGPKVPSNWLKRSLYFIARHSKLKYTNECQKQINKLDSIIKYGVQGNMTLFYSASDVIIFPSREPHQARPAFEAGLSGLPVIISDFSNTDEYIHNDENGLCFIPNDANDLSHKILQLYQDPELRMKLGENNRISARTIHSFERQKTNMLKVMEQVFSISGRDDKVMFS